MYIELEGTIFKVFSVGKNIVKNSKKCNCNMVACDNIECMSCPFNDDKMHDVQIVEIKGIK